MAEEQQEQSTGGSLKNVIIGFISTITLGVGGWITTKLTGGDEEKPAVQQAAPVINIQNSQTQQQSSGGKTVIIKETAKPAEQPKPKKEKEFSEEPKW